MTSSTPKAHAAIFDLAAQLFINQMSLLRESVKPTTAYHDRDILTADAVKNAAVCAVNDAQFFVQTFKLIVLDAKGASKQ